ncbi:MAG: carboxymuconolactone decarboxylase family protein [Wenzhouxiangella sp.]
MSNDIPKTFLRFTDRFPELAAAHRQAGSALDDAGPLDEKSRALVKLGVCAGAGLQSALKSHVRRGIENGLTREEIEHAVVLGMNSVGFPATVAAWQWAQNALEES